MSLIEHRRSHGDVLYLIGNFDTIHLFACNYYSAINIAPTTIAIAPMLFKTVNDSLKNNTDKINTKTILVLSMAATALTGPSFMARK